MSGLKHIFLDEYFEPALGRAIRVTLAFILPLAWGLFTGNMEAAVWIAIGAEVLTFAKLEGSYPVKLLILSGAVVASSVAGMLGTLAGGNDLWAILLMLLLAFLGGFVRQSGPQGPGITIGTLLIFLISLDRPGNWVDAGEMFIWVLCGGIIALVFTLFSWVFIPYSPFRRSISSTWKAMSDWLQLFSTLLKKGSGLSDDLLDEKELDFRTALNDSMEVLSRRQAIAHSNQNRLSYHLVELRRVVSFVDPAVSSLFDAIKNLKKEKDYPGTLILYIMENMSQAAHRIAISIISNRPENVYAATLSIQRIKNNIELLIEGLPKAKAEHYQLMQSLDEIVRYLEEAIIILKQMGKKSGSMTFFMRNFFTGMTIPQKIPLVRIELSWRSFAFRFALRLALAMGLGIAIYKIFNIPHGYWIAMTVMIILQPEFGATLTKAFRRIKGTILGAAFGSLIFLLPMPLPVSFSIVIVCVFIMAYYIQHNYAVAAFFITIMVIALYHLMEPVTWQLGLTRVLNTFGGAGLALLGGYAFFPLWERYRFPALMEEAIRANKAYFEELLATPEKGRRKKTDYLKPRREAEVANSNAFQSLRRMKEEPGHKQAHHQSYYIIIGYNIRLTRLLKTFNQQLLKNQDITFPEITRFEREINKILDTSAHLSATPGKGALLPDLPSSETLIRQLDKLINTFSDTDLEHRQMIRNLYERIAREAIGLYYSVQQLEKTAP